MGAQSDGFFIKDENHELPKQEIISKISDYIDDAKYEHGHGGYTGTMAEKNSGDVSFIDKEFTDASEAYDHIDEHADKWGSIEVIKIVDKGWVVGAVCSS